MLLPAKALRLLECWLKLEAGLAKPSEPARPGQLCIPASSSLLTLAAALVAEQTAAAAGENWVSARPAAVLAGVKCLPLALALQLYPGCY